MVKMGCFVAYFSGASYRGEIRKERLLDQVLDLLMKEHKTYETADQ